MNYDKFQKGDRVWSEMYGFDCITEVDDESDTVLCSVIHMWITSCGRASGFRARPRTFFHAVACTDEGMREAIARGEVLKRPVPRGRWHLQVGDRVIAFCESLEVKVGILTEDNHSDFDLRLEKKTGFTKEGLFLKEHPIPRAMRLYDGEEPFEDPCENMRWMMDEAIKFGWHEKYGKG